MTDDFAVDPFLGRDVGWLLESRVAEHGDREFLVWRDHDAPRVSWTYSQFAALVDAIATGLRHEGVGAGDRVCVHMSNRPEFLFSWFALARLGAVMVSTNVRGSSDELAYSLSHSRCRVVVTEPRQLPTVTAAVEGVAGVEAIVVADMTTRPETFDTLPRRGLSFSALAATVSDTFDPVDSQAPAGIQYTSGSTARPKAVVWTHANYLWGAKVSAAHEEIRADDRHLTFLPLFHTNAQCYSVMASLWVGAAVVLVPGFSASRFWSVAVEERTTWCSTVPFAIRALRSRPVPQDHAFRVWGTGLIAPSWERYFRVTLLAHWGMTETISHPIVSELHGPRRALAMGVAATEYEVRLVDDAGVLVTGPGEGLLEVRGRQGISTALCYLDDEAATAAAWGSDGWFRTGDRVVLHPDGWYEFVERDKDMLRVGGESVAASEIERVIARVDGVAEVAVVAAPDPMLDDVPFAFVLSTADASTLRASIAEQCERLLADFKRPRGIEIVDELPRVTLGKVSKKALRERAAVIVTSGSAQDG